MERLPKNMTIMDTKATILESKDDYISALKIREAVFKLSNNDFKASIKYAESLISNKLGDKAQNLLIRIKPRDVEEEKQLRALLQKLKI